MLGENIYEMLLIYLDMILEWLASFESSCDLTCSPTGSIIASSVLYNSFNKRD